MADFGNVTTVPGNNTLREEYMDGWNEAGMDNNLIRSDTA